MSLVVAIFSLTLVAQTLRMAVPYVFAALAGVASERSGVVNIALEGMLLVSGLAAIAAHVATGSAVVGVLAGAAAAAAMGAVHAVVVVKGRVDAIVSGLALNLAAAGGTRFVLRALYDSSSNSPAVAGFRGLLAEGSSGASLLARTLLDPLFLTAIAASLALSRLLERTRFGLRARACGEDPVAASAVGVDVRRVRVLAVTMGGALAGLGGVALAYDQHQFQAGMSGGRGFIALAAVIVSGWRPLPAAGACVAFAALDALQIVLQDQPWVPTALVQMLPYVATLGALVLVARRVRAGRSSLLAPPAGLGKHAD